MRFFYIRKKFIEILIKYKKYVFMTIGIIFVAIIAYEYYFKYIDIVRNPKKLKSIITSYGRYGVFVFLILQVSQVVAFFIPGEFVQIAGGYVYGPFLGSIISVIGITFGSIIAYVVSKVLGIAFLYKILSKKRLTFFKKMLDLKNINSIVFILYLIPGIPKDILAYVCGISRMNLKNFIIYSTLGRLPGIVISSYFGFKIYCDDKLMLILISVLIAVLFFIGFLKWKNIILKITRHKSSKNDNWDYKD